MMLPSQLPKRVLIVDDNPLQREFIVDLCRDLGIPQILQAADGIEALTLLMSTPDMEVMILDLEMPGMDGVQVLNELVRHKLKPAVLIASARESSLLKVVESMGHSLGINLLGVLQNPMTAEQLADCLSRGHDDPPQPATSATCRHTPKPTVEEIPRALAQGELLCYVQPKVNLGSGELVGVEALVRWQHPQHGLLQPAAFIEMVEHSPYISALTLHMLDLGLQHCQRWHATGLPLSLSLNISAVSLADSELASAIIQRVSASGITPRSVILEITESAIMSNPAITLGTLARLRLHGFGLPVSYPARHCRLSPSRSSPCPSR